MSVLGFQTNITPNDFFFLRANVSSITADTIVAKNISTLTGQVGSLTVSDLSANFGVFDTVSTNSLKVNSVDGAGRIESYEFSSVFTYADEGTVSTLFTQHIILDQATIDVVNGNTLLLNGVPIATTQDLSTIQDWAVYPAVSTVNMIGNNILNAGNITSQNIYNALAVQTDTLSALTSLTAPAGTITNTRATNISTTSLVASNARIPTLLGVDGVNNSTIVMSAFANLAGNAGAPTYQVKYNPLLSTSNFGNITTDGSGGLILTNWVNNTQVNTVIDVRRNATNTGYNSRAFFSTLQTGGISTGTLSVGGQPYSAGSNWAQFPANANVNLGGFDINSGNNAVLTVNALSNIQVLSQGYSNVVDRPLDPVNPAQITLNAKNGQRGKITIQADPGLAGIFGQIDITANGGTTGSVGTGGLINITANTPLGFSNLTSAVKISGAGVNSYAGLIPPIGSLAGYNFIYGSAGVNICAGLPSAIPNTPLTTFLYGTAGVEVGSDLYVPNIYPYWNGLTTPPDMLISGRYIVPNLAQVYVNLSNVKNLYMDSIGYIHNAKTIDMIDGTITQANTISGSNSISGYANISGTNGTFTTLSNTNLIGTGSVSGYTNISATNGNFNNLSNLTGSISSLTVSSINSFASFGTKSMRVQGDVAQIQLSNNNPAGAGTILNLLSRVGYSEIQSFNSNFTTPLPLVLNSSYTSTGALVVSTINGVQLPSLYGSFTATATQLVAGANTPTDAILDTTELANDIVLANPSTIQVKNNGVYRVLASPQFATTSGGQNVVDFWLTKNGTAIPRTNSQMTIQNNGQVFTSVEWLVQLNNGEGIGCAFQSADANMALTHYPATGSVPETPALIVNITQLPS